MAEFTEQSVIDYILSSLGHPTVNVELTQGQFQTAIGDALSIFNQWMCETNLTVVYNKSESVVLTLDEGVRGVVEVKFIYPESQRQISRINVFEMMYRMVAPGFPISDWYLYRSFFEMFQEVRGTEPDWRYDPFTRNLYIDAWSGPWDVFFVTCTDLSVSSFGSAKKAYQQKFKDLCMARAKRILAEVRGKFSDSIPAPGGNLSTNASRLADEAEKKEAEVVTWIKTVAKFKTTVRVG